MNFQPNTVVRLLSNVPLSLNETNQLWFDDVTSQTSYFSGKVSRTFNEFTYQRKERNYIAIPINAEKLYNCNYLMFQNTNYANKWFYGYITEIKYVNPNTSWVFYQIDPFQTWLFQLNFKDSYVEREHVKRYENGKPVINTIDEGLNYGTEYKVVSDKSYKMYGDTVFILVTAKDYLHKLTGSLVRPFPQNIGNVPQGFFNYIFPVSLTGYRAWQYKGSNLLSWAEFYDKINTEKAYIGKVVSLTLLDFVPLNVTVDNSNANITNMDNVTLYNARDDLGLTGSILYVNEGAFSDGTISCGNKYTDFPDYEESKLLMFPYSYTKITDMKGNEFDIKNEYINGDNLSFNVKGSIAPQNKVAYEVKNYKDNTNLLCGILNNNVSSMAIIDDYTAAYLQGNQNTLISGASVNAISSVVGTIGNLAVGNVSGAVGSGVGGIVEILQLNAKMKDIENHPPNLRNQGNNYNFDYANKYLGIRVIKYTITDEYKNTLTDYFKMFGYKVNRVKIPNLHTRQSWNYVKTVDCTIVGNMPQDDLNSIKQMFNKGITLWHNADVGNYALPNNEI
nr:MAG TPA: Major tail protein [Caudoviricetes sp.]